jgi:uncharacterized glyoxalase superfamily protein PhnB
MVDNPPNEVPRISPYLYYNDVDAALTWLSKTFGFRERSRMTLPDGLVAHAEMEFGGGIVMLGHPGPDYQNPRRLGGVTQGLYIYVDDVDEHYRLARNAGANILDEPADQFYGDRRYTTEDPEGHQWFFAQRVRDIAPEDLQFPG